MLVSVNRGRWLYGNDLINVGAENFPVLDIQCDVTRAALRQELGDGRSYLRWDDFDHASIPAPWDAAGNVRRSKVPQGATRGGDTVCVQRIR